MGTLLFPAQGWKLEQCFGDDAVTAVLGREGDARATASDDQVLDARESRVTV